MSGVTYEAVARFAQQGGSIYFGVLFVAGVLHAIWPKNDEAFRRLAQLPLEDDEAEHV